MPDSSGPDAAGPGGSGLDPRGPDGARPLAGMHVLLTGATGFLGQATLERLLHSYPDTRISVLIRPRGGRSGADRLAGLLRKNVFRTLREQLGEEDLRRVVAQRVTVIEGDLGNVTLPDDLDVVIHGASTVSFDPPVDEAFLTNVAGVRTIYEQLEGSRRVPHVVHVSTAYVAGTRKGLVPEASLEHQIDWELELELAVNARRDVERDSRRPEVLRELLDKARSEHAKAGPQSASTDAERRRVEWVENRLVEYGRMRAQTLGWPDVYTLTKALGERIAEQMWAARGRPLSIVRPAIVESAMEHPYPGWIDGFKMADPLLIAFGRGILKEFPGLPDSVLDVIPVDMVVNATLAAAASIPTGGPAYFHVGSGATNPLTFRDLYDHVRRYFTAFPLPDGNKGHITPPTWKFPGSQQVELALRTSERASRAAEKVLLRLPTSEWAKERLIQVTKDQNDLRQLREFADLYGVYTRAEVIYDDTRLKALHRSLPADRVEEFGFDPARIDWDHYWQDVHFPMITATVRRAGERRGTNAAKRGPKPLPERADVAAVFDLEGTVVGSNIVESYLWGRLSTMPRSRWVGELADLARSTPRYLYAEHRDRGELIRAFLRRYEGVRVDELQALIDDLLGDSLLQRMMPAASRVVRRHRAAGHRTILITGTVDMLVSPLDAMFDVVVASRMHAVDGVLTGFLESPPLVDEARAAWLRGYAEREGLDLSASYAYADSYSDQPLLAAVGHPQAVNPDPRLYRHARRHRWDIHNWRGNTGSRLGVLLDTVRTDLPVRTVRR